MRYKKERTDFKVSVAITVSVLCLFLEHNYMILCQNNDLTMTSTFYIQIFVLDNRIAL